MGVFGFFGVSNPVDIATGLLVIVLLAYAIGDFAANKTGALFSMIFVTGAVFLFGFWFGLPKDIFETVPLAKYAMIVMPFILVHMGTLMKVKDLLNEWKTVTIALCGLVGLSVGLYFMAGPIVGNIMALTAAGPISGGIVATIIVREAAELKGFANLAVFASLLLVLQNFVGLPIASLCLKSEGRRLLKKFRAGDVATVSTSAAADPEMPSIRIFPATPKDMQTPFILMFKTFLVGYMAIWFAQLTGGVVHKLVMALIFGIIFYETGFLEHNVLTKANAAGYAMFFCLIPVWTGLPNATPQMIKELVYPLVVCFGITVVALAITSLVVGKILGYSWALAMAISTTCLFGFPGTYVLSNEVSTALAKSAEEKKYVLDNILPRMLIGGFTTVTIGSVILAGYLAKVIAGA